MRSVSWTPLSEAEANSFESIKQQVLPRAPDILVIPGWLNRQYRRLVVHPSLAQTPCVMTMDTPWWGTARQRVGRWILRGYVAKMAQVIVPGERAWQYARRLGVPNEKITRGLYGVDQHALTGAWELRQSAGNWPKRFLFLGRYHRDKGLDLLVEAYRRYRSRVQDPWPLECAGQGPLKSLLANVPGIVDHGFMQPIDTVRLLGRCGVLALPSRYDPWPLALVEGAAAGLPIIASDACGSAVEVLRDGYNGWLIPAAAESLEAGLLCAHSAYSELSLMGERSQMLSAPYSNVQWAGRWHVFLKKLVLVGA